MKRLIIQMPCYNEAETLAIAMGALPKTVDGFDVVEYLVIDDGSRDNTAEIAKQCGAHYVIKHTKNQGLARAFMTGINAGLAAGADVIVNTDADNQYEARDIPKLVAPIIEKRADIVIGARPISDIEHFSWSKKLLQKIGSWVVRTASRTGIPDAPSGFRAYSRFAAQNMVVFSEYTYTLETIIQAGQKNMAIISVPIRTNPDLRPSRLVKSVASYVRRSIGTIIRIYAIYRPMRFFGTIGAMLFGLGFLLGLRFMFYYLHGDGAGHVQSVILAGALLVMGFQTILVAFLADLLAANRKLSEEIRLLLVTKKDNQK
ncbi:MAG TPA: glycosyltransferase family 2 protein [Methylophilus sp.]|nr:glycosyltransferase family 2 protein [Methylophilus sp.]HQQ32958.1 glycosyltransferase family 2 protein [Methylophilus sp.]